MIQVQSANSSIFVNAAFSPPLFEWKGVPAQFFEMVHSALTPNLAISPRDFSVHIGNSLDDVLAKFNIFGGASAVTLSAERLSIEFPNVSSKEYEFVLHLMSQIDASFSIKFPDRKRTTLQITSFEHADIVSDYTSIAYLEQFSIPSAKRICAENEALHLPSGKFVMSGNDATWRALCSVELSEQVANALFLHFELTLLNLWESDTFDSKMKRFKQISDLCMEALDLEWANDE